jgi:multimeric flavodoxin WrbA
MKRMIKVLISATCLLVSMVAARAECEQSQAFGGGVNVLIIDTTRVVIKSCNACFACVNAEGGYPGSCNTRCVPSDYVTPTTVVSVWNEETGQWDVACASGACQDYTTIDC